MKLEARLSVGSRQSNGQEEKVGWRVQEGIRSLSVTRL